MPAEYFVAFCFTESDKNSQCFQKPFCEGTWCWCFDIRVVWEPKSTFHKLGLMTAGNV